QVLQAQGCAVTARHDDRRSAWRLQGRGSVNRPLAAAVGFSHPGDVSSRYAGPLPVLAVDDFLDAAASIHPRTADGFDLSVAGRYALPIDARLALHARAGLFRWDAERSVRASDGRTVSIHDRGTDLLIGAGLGYAMTGKVDLTAEWMRYELDEEGVQAVSLGLRYRW